MNRMSWRAPLLLTLGVLVALISAGCTLSGATQAPPPDTQVGPSAVTEEPTDIPILVTPTTLIVVGSPTPVATFDTFATLTAGPVTGITPGAAATTPAVGVVTPTPVSTAAPASGGATATKAPTSSTAGTGSCPSTYTVQSGDNLFRIALRFNLTVAQLASANGIANPNVIIVGTVLKIPGCGTTPATGGSTSTTGTPKPQAGDTVATNGDILHTVKSGENLYRIALTYGLSWQAVATYNGLTSPDQLVVGQVIHIPTK